MLRGWLDTWAGIGHIIRDELQWASRPARVSRLVCRWTRNRSFVKGTTESLTRTALTTAARTGTTTSRGLSDCAAASGQAPISWILVVGAVFRSPACSRHVGKSSGSTSHRYRSIEPGRWSLAAVSSVKTCAASGLPPAIGRAKGLVEILSKRPSFVLGASVLIFCRLRKRKGSTVRLSTSRSLVTGSMRFPRVEVGVVGRGRPRQPGTDWMVVAAVDGTAGDCFRGRRISNGRAWQQ
jgi:hypothetical protein